MPRNKITDNLVVMLGGKQSIDSYMNIQLSNTEEFIDRKFTGALGQVLIRCVLNH